MRVAVYFATGYEEVEALTVVDVLRRAGVETVMVGVSGQTVESARHISINMDVTLEALNHEEIDMIVLPGGIPGVDHLAENPMVIENLKAFKEAGKWLAAICAGPSVLGVNHLLEGERATCYPGYEDKLLGATAVNERVVTSGKVVTGKGAGASFEFALEIVKVLVGSEAAQKVAQGMLIEF